MISMLLLMLAVVCFAISTWTPVTPNWHRLVAAGLAAWALAQLLSQVIK